MPIAFLQINVLDLASLIILLVGIIGGVRRGLSGELARFFSIGISAYLAWRLMDWAQAQVARQTDFTEAEARVAGALGVFFAVFLLLTLLRLTLRALMDFSFKGKVERLGGALCGLFRATVFLVVVVLLLSLVPHEQVRQAVEVDSVVGRLVCGQLKPVYEDLSGRVPELRLPRSPNDPPLEIPAGDAAVAPERPEMPEPGQWLTNEIPAGEGLGPLDGDMP